jgi:exopolysaccharide transport family protein
MLMRNVESYSSLDEQPQYDLNNEHDAKSRGVFELDKFWLLLRWRAKLIAAVTMVTFMVAGFALTVLAPSYRATTVVLVDPRQPRVTNSEVITGIGADAAAVESQVEIIESSALARKVIERLNLAADPDFASTSILDSIGDWFGALIGRDPNALAETRLNRQVFTFQKGLIVRRRGLTYVIEITFASKDPAKAARISNAAAEAYLDDQRSAKADITARASGWLGGRIEEMRDKVRAAERAVADYKSEHGLVDVTQGNKLISRQVEDLTQQLALTRTRTAEAQARLEQVQQVTRRTTDPAALAEALQSQVITALRSQYAEAARLEAEYRTLYGDRHPSLIAVRSQLADVRRLIDNEIARILAGVRNDYEVAKNREAALTAELQKLKSQSEEIGQADVKLRELEREAQANRTLFEQFLNRAKETGETLQIADARIISPALVPLKPSRPPAILLMIAAGIAGLILGIGLVLLLEQVRRRFRSARDVRDVLALPTLGLLPEQSLAASTATPASPPAVETHVVGNANETYVSNLRTIRTRLRRSGKALHNEVVVIMSALPDEGKSTFACDFALDCALSGIRTLLIDGDSYVASVSRSFDSDYDGPGLTDVLDGKVSVLSAAKHDPESGLYILGKGSSAARQEINTAALANFVQHYRTQFDLIIIDTPATLSVDVTHPFIECADRAVLVIEWERTERQAVREALASLEGHARKVAGVVLNKVSMEWYRLFENGRYVRYYNQAGAPR